MPKLSANVASVGDPNAIIRVDLTPEKIKTMTDDEILAELAKFRPNREFTGGAAKTRAPKSQAPAEPEVGDDFV